MSEVVQLIDLCKEELSGKYGIPASAEDYDSNKVRYLRITDIDDNGNLLNSDIKSVSSPDINKYLLSEGDIVFARTGNSTGRTYYHQEKNGKLAFAGFLIKFTLDSRKVNPMYLKYYTISSEYKTWVKNLSNGSTRGNINAQTFASCPIKLPERVVQDNLVQIMSAIDQKIALNNQINEELEAMAKTLYDYWFVQFDFPDQNGNPYKSSGGKMVYNPELKREIPEGWGVEKIENIAQTGSGGTPKSTNVSYYSNGEIPWINSGELEQMVITSTSNFITEEGLNNSSAKLFPSGTILVAMYGATAGKVSFLTFEVSTNQAICAIMLTDIRMRYYLKNVIEDLYQYLVKLSTGSARDNLSQDMIKNIKVVIPSNDILDRFYDFSNNVIKEITKKQQENEQLTQLRDWLLPMLMNGQVKVEDKT